MAWVRPVWDADISAVAWLPACGFWMSKPTAMNATRALSTVMNGERASARRIRR